MSDADMSALDASSDALDSGDRPRLSPIMRNSGISAMSSASSVTSMINVAPGMTQPRLFAAVHVGATCGDASVPSVSGVMFNGISMTLVGAVLGTPCSTNLTRTELFELANPTSGVGTVAATLSGTARTVHLNGFLVERAAIVGPPQTRSDDTLMGSVDIPTVAGDLAFAIVGTGDPMQMTADVRYSQNRGGMFTLDNSALFSRIASDSVTTLLFSQGIADEWQALGVAVRGPLASP